MNGFSTAKSWLAELTEIGLLLVALGVTVQILFGAENTAFVGPVVENLTSLIRALGSEGLVGLVAIGVIIHLFRRRTA